MKMTNDKWKMTRSLPLLGSRWAKKLSWCPNISKVLTVFAGRITTAYDQALFIFKSSRRQIVVDAFIETDRDPVSRLVRFIEDTNGYQTQTGFLDKII
jgi:hypothetical protein